MSASSPREEHFQAWVDMLRERVSVLEASRCERCRENEAALAAALATDPLSFEASDV